MKASHLVAPVWKLNGHPRTLIGDGWLSFKNPGPATSGQWGALSEIMLAIGSVFFQGRSA